MSVVLFDERPQDLFPLTFTRPVGDLRLGIFTFAERWNYLLKQPIFYLTQDYLQEKYPSSADDVNLYINPKFFPTSSLVDKIMRLEKGEAIFSNNFLLAFHGKEEDLKQLRYKTILSFNENLIHIERTWHLFMYNNQALDFDFQLVKRLKKKADIPQTVSIMGNAEQIFIEEGAKISYCYLNAEKGPIFIAKDAEVMEGVMVRGGLALCEGATLNMGAKIYGPTTIGPYSKVGGEVNNCIIWGYSNKAHDGFLGNSIIGQWCNLGADTNNSNLKNNYSSVNMWDYDRKCYVNTGLMFCGLVMGDHSKSAINTQFNTGTTCGVFSILFDSGFLPTFIPNFIWGGKPESPKIIFEKALDIAERVMKRRNVHLHEADIRVLEKIYNTENNF